MEIANAPVSSSVAVEFDPPTMGNNDVPIPIVGAGSLEVEAGGLRVRGIKQKSFGLLTAGLYLGTFFVFIVSLVVLGMLREGSFDTRWNTRIAAVIAAAFAAGASTLLRKKKRAASEQDPERLDYLIPWPSVKALLYQEELVILRIVKHKPKGGLFFRVSDVAAFGRFKVEIEQKGVKLK
jgi:hypothetical protein